MCMALYNYEHTMFSSLIINDDYDDDDDNNNINNNNNNTKGDGNGAFRVIESPVDSSNKCRTSFGPAELTWTVNSPVACSSSTSAVVISCCHLSITQPKS